MHNLRLGPKGTRQLALAAPLQATAASATAFSCTITVNEPGVAHMKDAVFTAASDAALTNGGVDFSAMLEVQAITLNGSVYFLRGRNTASAPNPFSPHRQGNLCAFPSLSVRSGDTIVVTGFYVYAGATGDAYFGIPFSPARFRDLRDPVLPQEDEVWTGSPATAVADGVAVVLTATIDTPGIIDLKRIAYTHHIDPTLDVEGSAGVDASWYSAVRALQVRSDYAMIVGQGTPSCPGGFFHPARQRNLIDLGRHEVVPGDTVTMTVFLDQGGDGDATFGFPLYPTGRGGGHGGMGNLQGVGVS